MKHHHQKNVKFLTLFCFENIFLANSLNFPVLFSAMSSASRFSTPLFAGKA